MDIQMEHRSREAFCETLCQERRVQLNMETVVPDTNEDIGRVVTVRPCVFLKSKEVLSGRIAVSGELEAVLLYITEGENRLASVRLTKPFSLNLDDESIRPDSLAQVRLRMGSVQARLVNPRKVAAAAELAAEFTVFARGETLLSACLQDTACQGLHVKTEEAKTVCLDWVSEKSFVLSEQFVFPAGEAEPEELLAEHLRFNCLDCQQLGSRAIVKGEAEVELYYLNKGGERAGKQSFHTPFSQILDVGEADFDRAVVQIEPTAAYFELTDTIGGEKALDAEIHAVLFFQGSSSESLRYIADVYSNRMPVRCQRESLCLFSAAQETTESLSGDQVLELAEDCEELLCAFPTVTQLSCAAPELKASVQLDLLYRSHGGTLSCVRRQMELSKLFAAEKTQVLSWQLKELDLRQEGEKALCRADMRLRLMARQYSEIDAVSSVTLLEEDRYQLEQYPAFTLVRFEGESLWDLARQYHSSEEAIAQANELDGDLHGRLLLIPKQA